ncbi:MAG TPA: 3-oxoadipate enol-lactonase [Candidatus Acidoferrum sp.]|nr:3-oxoadipate enol-lactonase [Candidatus Acidoferrum sp.]
MPFADLSDVRIHYSFTGPHSAPILVFSNSLGANFSMWDAQVAALNLKFRILRYDTRGHGQSSVTPGPYNIELLANDVLRLLDALHLDRVHFCGLSMGGQTGMWLGINAARRLHKLVLCNTGATIGTADSWKTRIDAVLARGTQDVSAAILSRWFTAPFAAQHPDVIAKARAAIESTNPLGYTANCAAVCDYDSRVQLSSILVPTLVIAGTHDLATPVADGRFIADHIPGARFLELPAAHLSNIECAAAFSSALESFLLS